MSNANHRRPKRDADRAKAQGDPDAATAPASNSSPGSPEAAAPTGSTQAVSAPIAAEHEAHAAQEAVHRLSTAEPLDVDGARTVGIGVAMWAVAGLVLLIAYRDELEAEGNQWWLWTCLAGVGLGLLGWAYSRRRRDQTRALRAASTGSRREN